jgi:hypothetical protein
MNSPGRFFLKTGDSDLKKTAIRHFPGMQNIKDTTHILLREVKKQKSIFRLSHSQRTE